MKKLFPALLLSTLTPLAQADVGDVSVGLGASLLQGYGVELGYEATEHLDVRGIYYKASIARDFSADNVDYDASIKAMNTGLMLDYFPTKGRSFKMVLGAVNNGNKISGTASSGTYDIGGNTYTNTTISTEVSFDSIAYYAGLGYDAHFTDNLGVGFAAGLLYTGSPSVTMEASSTSGPIATADIDEAIAAAEDDLSVLKFLPMLKMNLFYKF